MTTKQQSSPLHIENTVNSLAREELQLPQAFKTYRNMLQDEYIGGGMNLVKSLLNKTKPHIKVDDKATGKEKDLVVKLNKSFLSMTGMTQTQFMNYALSCTDYGIALFEVVLERKGGFNVFKTLSPIHPKDVKKYVFKGNVLERLELYPAENDGQLITQSEEVNLKGDKVLMIRLNHDLDNPLGRSLLQRCYTSWKCKQIATEYELIGISKDLSGALKIKAPAEYINDYYNEPTSENAIYIDNLLSQAELLHAGKVSQVLVASDTQENGVSLFDVETIGNNGGTRFDVNTTIERYNKSLLITLYTDILALGNGATGSYSLASSKTSLLGLFMESLQSTISDSFEHVLDYVYKMNGVEERTSYLAFEDVNEIDPDEFTKGWQRLAQSGLVTPDEELESFFREKLDAPKADYEKKLNNDSKADESERLESAKEI